MKKQRPVTENESVFRIRTKKQPIIDGSPTFEKVEEKSKTYFWIGTYF